MDPKKARQKLQKDKLQNEISKAIKTTMIGALSSVEDKFGKLWGFNEERELTNNEQFFLDLFTELRKEILDKGNTQIKKVKNLVEPLVVDYVGYQLMLTLPVKKDGNNE